MNRAQLRGIPSVDKLLLALGDTGLPHPIVVDVVRKEIAALRKGKSTPDFDSLLARFRVLLHEIRTSRIQPIINGTGILIHTNFGRAPLAAAAMEALLSIGSNYNNLEYELSGGARGGRAAHLERSLSLLCGSEAATVVNNNAAALVLILRHFCQEIASAPARRSAKSHGTAPSLKNEVVISRGELIQIGGGFRIPEILEASGARLREVGTTNKTSLSDYARAITRETALILKVHRSNFYMGGFVESPTTEEIAELTHNKRVAFVEDLGSGAMVETQTIAGLEHEPTPAEMIRRGVDLICFSGDKLLGGPQAGIICGRAKLVAAIKREPLFRALRCDKLILSALEATVDLYLRQDQNKPSTSRRNREVSRTGAVNSFGIPVIDMLRLTKEELTLRASKIVSVVNNGPITAAVGTGKSQVGGGTLPRSTVDSVTIDLGHTQLRPQEIAARLREHGVPIIGYVSQGAFKLDLRTIFPGQDAEVVRAIQALPA